MTHVFIQLQGLDETDWIWLDQVETCRKCIKKELKTCYNVITFTTIFTNSTNQNTKIQTHMYTKSKQQQLSLQNIEYSRIWSMVKKHVNYVHSFLS